MFLRVGSQDAQRKQKLDQEKSLSYLSLPGSLLPLNSPPPAPASLALHTVGYVWLLLSDAVSANG